MNEKWVEQVEKSFLWNEGGCRDVSAWKRKETRRCLHQDTNSFITPSLHLCFFQVHNVSQQTNKIQNRDVGMGLWMSLCLGVGIFLFPFFFMHWHPCIPHHFIEMIFPLVYILGRLLVHTYQPSSFLLDIKQKWCWSLTKITNSLIFVRTWDISCPYISERQAAFSSKNILYQATRAKVCLWVGKYASPGPRPFP